MFFYYRSELEVDELSTGEDTKSDDGGEQGDATGGIPSDSGH